MSSKRHADSRLIGRWTPTTCARLALILCAWPLSWALPVEAANKTWTNSVTGSWTVAANWTGGVPTATDSATFNQAGDYMVNFTSVFQSLNNMSFSAGTVTFERLVSPATLVIDNASGGRNLTIGNATINMGQSLAVNITVGNDAIINSGGMLNVRAGSFLNPQDLFVNAGGTLSLTNGTITPSGTTQIDGNATISQGSLTTTNDFSVGFSGTGTLAISNGGGVTSGTAVLGVLSNSTGTATVTGAGASWSASSHVIGSYGSGTLLIENGGSAVSGFGAGIGGAADSTGRVTVTGAGSIWSQGGDLYVGGSGAGALDVGAGGAVTTTRETYIGGAPGAITGIGTGAISVQGVGSQLTTTRLHIGYFGTGQLTIADGGLLRVDPYWLDGATRQTIINAQSTVNIGAGGLAGTLESDILINNGALNFNHTDAITQSAAISGSGSITKTGAGSTTLTNAAAFAGRLVASGGQLILQGSLNATLYAATPGGTLRFDSSTANLSGTSAIRASGGMVEYIAATVNGGILRGDLPGTGTHTIVSSGLADTNFNGVTIQNSVDLVQNGYANFTNVTNGGRLTSNQFLFYDGGVNTTSGHMIVNQLFSTRDFTNNGQITVNAGGTLSHWLGNLASGGGSRTTVNAGGTITLLGGAELDLNGALLINNGTVSGTTNVNYGSLAKGTGSYGVVNVNEGGVYSPGNSPGISTAAAVEFQIGSFASAAPQLAIELAGITPGSEYDQLHVTGQLSLAGVLDVSLTGGFMPAAGNSFDILDWGSLAGTFSSLQLPTLTGLVWNTSQLYTTGILSVAASGLDGDYNQNGIVDAADYVVWRKGLGTTYTPEHYNIWRAHFGETAGGGSGAHAKAAVPEPATALILVVGMLMLAFVIRCRKERQITIDRELMIGCIRRLGLRGFALLVVLGLGSSPAQATKYWKNSVITGNWGTLSNWSAVSPAGADNAGIFVGGEAVNIVNIDGTARTVTLNVTTPSLGLLSIDLIGPGTTASTLSMPSNNSLTANGIYVGGYSGITQLPTSGRGALEQFAGTVATNPGWDFVLGHGLNSTGTYTLSGGALVANQSEYVGLSGNGTFNHTAGSNTINASAVGSFIVGLNASSTGAYNLSGTGALVTKSTEYVGYSGAGIFTHTGGTHAIGTVAANRDLYLAYNVNSSGNYTLDGSGSSLSVNGDEHIGYHGTGSFTQSDGTHTVGTAATNRTLYLGDETDSSGSYQLLGGTLTVNGSVTLGYYGPGSFTQSGGTHTVTRDLRSGGTSGSPPGVYTLSGGVLTVGEFESIGVGNNTGNSFTQTGGTHTIGVPIGLLALASGTDSTASYSLTDGSLTVNGGETVGGNGAGTFTQSGGTHTIISSGLGGAFADLSIGKNFGGVGTYALSGDGVLTVDGDEYIGNQGAGEFTQSGGTHTVGSVATNRQLYVGYDGSFGASGSYTLLSGTLAVNGSEQVGYYGPGSFTQSGGTHTVSRNLRMGGTSGSPPAVYALSGGVLTVEEFETIGAGNNTGNSFTQTGGVHTIGAPIGILALAVGTDSSASYSMSGGSLTVNGGEHVGGDGAGTFTQSGGTHTILSSGFGGGLADLSLGGNAGGAGTYALSGDGVLAVTGDVYVGGSYLAAGGKGVMNLTSGTATATGALKVYNTANTLVTLAGATLSVGSLDTDGNASRFNWTSGALNLTNSSLTIGGAGPLGTSLTIDSAKALTVSGTTTIDPFRALTLNGGNFSTGDLVNNGTFNFVSGTLEITGAGGLTIGTGGGLGDTVNLNLSQTLNVTNLTTVAGTGTLVVGEGRLDATGGITNNGEVRLSGLAPRITGGTITNNKLIRGDGRIDNSVTNASAGEIRAEDGKTLLLTGANGANAGKVNLQGGTIEFTQPLTNAGAGQILGRGKIMVGGAGLSNQGHVALSSGITDVFGTVANNTGVATRGISVSGNAEVTFWDDVTNLAGSLFKVSSGSSATFFGTFAGTGITGTGDVYFEADVSPGASPAIAEFGGKVAFASTSTLNMELGGTTRGSQYDAILASGNLSLGGMLAVSLIDAGAGLFAPAAGDSFDILDWGALSGTFSTIQLPTLTGALAWNTSQLYTTGVVSVASPGLPGDYNNNGVVDGADYVVWRKNNNMATTLPNDSTPGTDQTDYTVWRAHFGQTAGSGSGANANAAVPEPAALVLLILGSLAMYSRRATAVS